MIVLGINDDFDSGAAVVKDGRIISAVNEERISRIKFHEGHYYGWPRKSVLEAIRLAGIKPEDIDYVAIVGTVDPPLPVRIIGYRRTDSGIKEVEKMDVKASFLEKRAYEYFAGKKTGSLTGRLSKCIIKKFYARFLKSMGIPANRIVFVDHHRAHADGAYYTSGLKKALVVTMDGHGDGLSSSIRTYEGKELEVLATTASKESLGWFYSQVTHCLGFKMHRHEGKITGLAAYGKPEKAYGSIKDAIDAVELCHVNRLGSKFVGVSKLNAMIDGHSREDVAAAAQARFEEVITEIISKAVDRTGISDIALAGGCFANVKLNQRILELENVKSVFIHPHMGDGGLTAGAALSCWARFSSRPRPYKLNDVYFGPSFSNKEIEQELKKHGLKYEYHKDIEKVIAHELSKKRVVGRFFGKMEYGPRALGNRSILADPTDTSINDWLNKRLVRTEFMPFAPSLMDRTAPSYYEGYKNGEYPARFMTITFDCTRKAKIAPAVIHVDNTARPQVVSQSQNSRYYRILREYSKLTGLPVFVNTSFNMHEEPIVRSPYDAIRAFKLGSVDTLAIGNFTVKAVRKWKKK